MADDEQACAANQHSAEACGAREVMTRVGDKWTLHVIHLLGFGKRRFMELRREIDGISQRMLTVTLRGLERDGLVTRTVHPVVPPRVEYELTTLGATLLETVCALMHWSVDHLDDIARARSEYDARQAETMAEATSEAVVTARATSVAARPANSGSVLPLR